MRRETKTVAVVVPMSNRGELTPDEQISFRHLLHFLGRYDKYLVVPKGLKLSYSGFERKRFDDKFFGSIQAHRRLLFSPQFFKSFRDYKYILIYHPDALVFSDQLEFWCQLDFDYIGAPWVKHKDAPYSGHTAYEGKVGNGGFALMKVESFLRILYSRVYYIQPSLYWRWSCGQKPFYARLWNVPKWLLKHFIFLNGARWELQKFNSNDDNFWANRGPHYYPQFKIPPIKTALRFAFECVPRYCFQLNNYTLPFGCHAWARYDRQFWEPYLLK
jgi:hypothetical protein